MAQYCVLIVGICRKQFPPVALVIERYVNKIHQSAIQHNVTWHRLWRVEEGPRLFQLIINWAVTFPAIVCLTKISEGEC